MVEVAAAIKKLQAAGSCCNDLNFKREVDVFSLNTIEATFGPDYIDFEHAKNVQVAAGRPNE